MRRTARSTVRTAAFAVKSEKKERDGKKRRTAKRASRKRKARSVLDFPFVVNDILSKSKRGFKFFFGFLKIFLKFFRKAAKFDRFLEFCVENESRGRRRASFCEKIGALRKIGKEKRAGGLTKSRNGPIITASAYARTSNGVPRQSVFLSDGARRRPFLSRLQ